MDLTVRRKDKDSEMIRHLNFMFKNRNFVLPISF